MTSTVATYRWCAQHGFKPVALHPRSKAAVSRDYVEDKYQTPPEEVWSATSRNIGVVLGPNRGGPADVDIDCKEAGYFSALFLPPTKAVFGRKSKPRSHYLYKLTGPQATVQIADKSSVTRGGDRMIIELRADANTAVQTVMPGSVHESGELVDWVDDGDHEPATIEAADLLRAVRKVAAAVIVTRHFWLEGLRYQNVLCIAGVAHRLGWTLDETLGFVQAVMDYNGSKHAHHLDAIRSTYRKMDAGQKCAGLTTLKKVTGDEIAANHLLAMMRGFDDPVADALDAFRENWALVNYQKKLRAVDLSTPPGTAPEFYEHDAWKLLTSTKRVTMIGDNGKPKDVPLATILTRSMEPLRAEFLPGVKEPPPGVFNIWTGWKVEAKPGDCSAFLELQKLLCKGDEQLELVLNLFWANALYEPMKKPKIIPAWGGAQGAGKTTYFDYLQEIFGDYLLQVSTVDQITGRFAGESLQYVIVAVADEVTFGRDHRQQNALKGLSGNKTRAVEVKFGSTTNVKSYTRPVISSNHIMDAAPIEADDTRYVVVDVRGVHCPKSLRDRCLAELRNGGAAALLHYYAQFKDPGDQLFEARKLIRPPEIVAEVKIETEGSVAQFWHHKLMNGQLLGLDQQDMQEPSSEPWPTCVARPAVYHEYSEWCKETRPRQFYAQGAFWIATFRMLGSVMKGTVLTNVNHNYLAVNRDRQEVADWILKKSIRKLRDKNVRQAMSISGLPPLQECRKAFETYLGQPLTWAEAPDELPPAPEDDVAGYYGI